ncbi:TetR/AcrR family transcriptional regulator [Mycobacterium sp. CVI_P3]|uniref:TetR/AcrR family transcriptional regulator n=2 Tax=Mycobacterium pinniadriaticum TaxID=2994102 RepID=A0ABT3SLT7_9MYCO|nr:TetR/AcrR family transcriptional regulator [Mycobacterium pinniadriaticum]MCX2933697.1 TetR/AcrR family transcriptional regulator [Mycobacterium pinniadriaticum]MCX2940119.1 TetR/AcrR family transcriptional regulator [Mycobacterium pinniadriaticum]
MSDIAAEAGVSPGTLYRYFKNKEDILSALGDYYMMRLRGIIQQAIADEPEPADRLRVVVDVMLRFWQDNPATVQLGQMEPGFVLAYIKNVVPRLSAVIHDALEPVLAHSPAVQLGVVTVDDVVEIIVRIAFSNYFMPAGDYHDLRDLCVALGIAAGLEPKKSRGAGRRKAVS